MSPTAARGEELAAYLGPGADQRRLLRTMADGHARAKHGPELGNPSRAAYQDRVGRHLAQAPLAVAVTDNGRTRYPVADPRTNQAAWIVPHKEHRSTFFQPRHGVSTYVHFQRLSHPPAHWREYDADRVQALRVARPMPARSGQRDASPPTRRVVSAARQPPPSSRAR